MNKICLTGETVKLTKLPGGYSTRTSHIGASPYPRQIYVTPTQVSHIDSGNMMDDIREYARKMLPSIKYELEKQFAEESKIAAGLQSRFFACHFNYSWAGI